MDQSNEGEQWGFRFEDIQVSFAEPVPSVLEGHMAIQHILPGTSANLLTAVKAKVGEFPVFLVPTFGDLQGRTGNDVLLSDVSGGTFGEIVGINSESSQIIAKMFYRNAQAGSLNLTLVQFPPGMDTVVVPNALLIERARGQRYRRCQKGQERRRIWKVSMIIFCLLLLLGWIWTEDRGIPRTRRNSRREFESCNRC